MRLNTLKNSAGFGLIETLIALGIVSIIGLTVGQVMNQSMMLANNVKNKQAQMDDSNLVRMLISNPAMCKAALRNTSNNTVRYNGNLQKGTSDDNFKIQRIVATNGAAMTTFIERDINRGDITYTDIYLGAQTGQTNTVRSDGKTYRSRLATVVLESKSNKELMGGDRTDSVTIPINIVTGPDNDSTIVDCSSYVQPDVACISLGGIYDGNRNPACMLTSLGVSDDFADRDKNRVANGIYSKGSLKTAAGLDVAGAATIGSGITVTGPVVLRGDIAGYGANMTGDMNIFGDTHAAKKFLVSGTMTALGNVGIGTDKPSEKLDVVGKIMSRTTIVKADSGDTVTNKRYVDIQSFAQKGFCSKVGEFVKGFDADGNRICGTEDTKTENTCSAGTYMVGITSGGNSVCQPVSSVGSCPSGQAMVGINTSGGAICGNVIKGSEGPQGAQGVAGATGAQGPQGPVGPRGPAGSDGADGGMIGRCTIQSRASAGDHKQRHCCSRGDEVIFSIYTPTDDSAESSLATPSCAFVAEVGKKPDGVQLLCCR